MDDICVEATTADGAACAMRATSPSEDGMTTRAAGLLLYLSSRPFRCPTPVTRISPT